MLNRSSTSKSAINYVWIGPPKLKTGGQDVVGVRSLYKNIQKFNLTEVNPVIFWCLKEYQHIYQEYFDHQMNLQVESVNDYIDLACDAESQEFKEEAPNQAAYVRDALQRQLYSESRNRTVDRVAFKDLFFIFLLSREGGYVLDSNVQASDKQPVCFPEFENYHCPTFTDDLDLVRFDSWMQYCPFQNRSAAQTALQYYIDNYHKTVNEDHKHYTYQKDRVALGALESIFCPYGGYVVIKAPTGTNLEEELSSTDVSSSPLKRRIHDKYNTCAYVYVDNGLYCVDPRRKSAQALSLSPENSQKFHEMTDPLFKSSSVVAKLPTSMVSSIENMTGSSALTDFHRNGENAFWHFSATMNSETFGLFKEYFNTHRDLSGKYPQHFLHAARGNVDRLRFDFEHGIQPNDVIRQIEKASFFGNVISQNETLLHIVMRNWQKDLPADISERYKACVELLLENNIDINAVCTVTICKKGQPDSTEEFTALKFAIDNECLAGIELLRARGARDKLENSLAASSAVLARDCRQ